MRLVLLFSPFTNQDIESRTARENVQTVSEHLPNADPGHDEGPRHGANLFLVLLIHHPGPLVAPQE